MGILPKSYTLTSLEAFQKEGSLNVQAGTAFVDFEFLEEVSAGFMVDFLMSDMIQSNTVMYDGFSICQNRIDSLNKLYI